MESPSLPRTALTGSPYAIRAVIGLSLLLLLQLASQQLLGMWSTPRSRLLLAFAPLSGSTLAQSMADLGWYPPAQNPVNNLTQVIDGTGTYGWIFNSPTTPDENYGTYNWCNMPHARVQEYVRSPDEYELVYVELVSMAS
jgi:hypothetical protein